MPDSARQNAQPGAPAPLEESENGQLEKKGARGGGVVRGALCLVISVWVLLGTYGAVGGTFFKIKTETGKLSREQLYFCLITQKNEAIDCLLPLRPSPVRCSLRRFLPACAPPKPPLHAH